MAQFANRPAESQRPLHQSLDFPLQAVSGVRPGNAKSGGKIPQVSQQSIIEAVDYKFQDIERHLMRIEESLDKTYGRILERHESLLTKIARKLGLEEDLQA